jgi:glycosyltransferase involved in cell wall biosynthesis
MNGARAGNTPALNGDRSDDYFLRRNDAHYQALVRQLLKFSRRDAETTSWCVAHLAEFCCLWHTGRFADGRIENVLLEIGGRLDSLVGARRLQEPRLSGPGPGTSRHILHVSTHVLAVGGTTRLIKHWINSDPANRHSLLLTWQQGIEIPGWMAETVRGQGGELVVLPEGASLLARARSLREAARGADLVVLHHVAYDVIPELAFAVEDGPPVARLNTGDHLFWLGNSVADTVIHVRGASRVLDGRRFTCSDVMLPILLDDTAVPLTQARAREQLGIPAGEIVLLSVGRACKYIPTRKHHFVRTAARILDRHPEVHLYVVGASENDERVCGGVRPHPRLHFVGPLEDPSVYHRAADVYLETFPFGGQTALLEAALAGLPCVRAFAPPFDLVVADDEALDGLFTSPDSEEDYVEQTSLLIRDPEARHYLGAKLKDQVLFYHTGEHWQRRLDEVYRHVCGLRHRPRPLPETTCLATDRDIALSIWQAYHMGNDSPLYDFADDVRKILLSTACSVRQTGNYRAALGLLCQCLRHWGWSSQVVRAAATLFPHWMLCQLGCPR